MFSIFTHVMNPYVTQTLSLGKLCYNIARYSANCFRVRHIILKNMNLTDAIREKSFKKIKSEMLVTYSRFLIFASQP